MLTISLSTNSYADRKERGVGVRYMTIGKRKDMMSKRV